VVERLEGETLAARLEPLHHQVRDAAVGAVGAPHVEERADVRMAERGDRAGLALEAGAAVGIGGELVRQHLDRDEPVEPRVAGGEDLAHTPAPQRAHDFVGTEPLARRQAHGAGDHERTIPAAPGTEKGERNGSTLGVRRTTLTTGAAHALGRQ